MRTGARGGLLVALLVGAALVGLAAPAGAVPDEILAGPSFGVRGGAWIDPRFDMDLRFEQADGSTLRLDVEEDLGVEQRSDALGGLRRVVPELEAFVTTRWLSVSVWSTVPFEYRGDTVLTQEVELGGVVFESATRVTSRFEQFLAGGDLRVNLVDDAIVLFSPLVGVRVFGVDWQVLSPELGTVVRSRDLNWPLRLGDTQLLPFPVVGLDLRLGLRRYFEVYARASGVYADVSGFRLSNVLAETGVTVYPVPNLGLQGGFRYLHVQARDEDAARRGALRGYDLDLDFYGATASLIARF